MDGGIYGWITDTLYKSIYSSLLYTSSSTLHTPPLHPPFIHLFIHASFTHSPTPLFTPSPPTFIQTPFIHPSIALHRASRKAQPCALQQPPLLRCHHALSLSVISFTWQRRGAFDVRLLPGRSIYSTAFVRLQRRV